MPMGQALEASPVTAAARFPHSDLELISAFRAGNEQAFDQLYLRHQDYVYNVCLGIVSNADDARDCTQETFLRVYRKVREFRAEAAFSTWLYRVAANVCVGQLRKRGRTPVTSLEAENMPDLPDDGPEPWTGLEREDGEKLVREVVAALSDDYRLMLTLRYFQDLSYEEMVEVLGYSLAQVKVKLHRARRAFAREWAARGYGAAGAL